MELIFVDGLGRRNSFSEKLNCSVGVFEQRPACSFAFGCLESTESKPKLILAFRSGDDVCRLHVPDEHFAVIGGDQGLASVTEENIINEPLGYSRVKASSPVRISQTCALSPPVSSRRPSGENRKILKDQNVSLAGNA